MNMTELQRKHLIGFLYLVPLPMILMQSFPFSSSLIVLYALVGCILSKKYYGAEGIQLATEFSRAFSKNYWYLIYPAVAALPLGALYLLYRAVYFREKASLISVGVLLLPLFLVSLIAEIKFFRYLGRVGYGGRSQY